MGKLKEFIQSSLEAQRVYASHKGIPTDIGPFLTFFTPPVCEHADERMANVLGTTKRRGNYLYRKGNEFPFAHIATRLVVGLDIWIPSAPKRIRMRTLIKNPMRVSGGDMNDVLGVRNALVLYETDTQSQAFLGGVTHLGVCVIRPVADRSLQESIINDYRKHIQK